MKATIDLALNDLADGKRDVRVEFVEEGPPFALVRIIIGEESALLEVAELRQALRIISEAVS